MNMYIYFFIQIYELIMCKGKYRFIHKFLSMTLYKYMDRYINRHIHTKVPEQINPYI